MGQWSSTSRFQGEGEDSGDHGEEESWGNGELNMLEQKMDCMLVRFEKGEEKDVQPGYLAYLHFICYFTERSLSMVDALLCLSVQLLYPLCHMN